MPSAVAEQIELIWRSPWTFRGSAPAMLNYWISTAALNRLEELDPRKARLVELRFFLSCTTEEACKILGVSHATAERELKFVRGWLYRELHAGTTPIQHQEHGTGS